MDTLLEIWEMRFRRDQEESRLKAGRKKDKPAMLDFVDTRKHIVCYFTHTLIPRYSRLTFVMFAHGRTHQVLRHGKSWPRPRQKGKERNPKKSRQGTGDFFGWKNGVLGCLPSMIHPNEHHSWFCVLFELPSNYGSMIWANEMLQLRSFCKV